MLEQPDGLERRGQRRGKMDPHNRGGSPLWSLKIEVECSQLQPLPTSTDSPLILRIRAGAIYGARGSTWVLNILNRLLGPDRRSPKDGVARHRRQN